MKSLVFEKKDGTQYKLRDLGIKVVDFEPESLDVINNTVMIDGNGVVVNRLGYSARFINAVFFIHNNDLVDYALFRSELFDMFIQDESFYIIDEKDTTKRWHVCSDGKFSLSRNLKSGTFDISFLCVNHYQESVMTSMELSNDKFWDVDKFSWNGMITWDDDLNYKFFGNSFTINNLGTANVIPEDGVLRIKIKANASNFLEITNITTGDTFRYKKPLTSNDTLMLDGVRVTKNGVNVLLDTNMEFISLKPGLNEFTITGGSVEEVEFDFRFLFK